MPARNANRTERAVRGTALCRVAALLAATAFGAAIPGAAAARLNPTETAFLREVNATRSAHALPKLELDPKLLRAARAHSADMVTRQYFAHGPFGSRLLGYGASGPRLGEDLGWSVDDGKATTRIMRGWLASPPHRAVLLRRSFHSVGIGVARGRFEGWAHAIVVTADFEGD